MGWLRSAFQDELDGVTNTLVDLSNLVTGAIEKATHALLTANLDEAQEVIDSCYGRGVIVELFKKDSDG